MLSELNLKNKAASFGFLVAGALFGMGVFGMGVALAQNAPAQSSVAVAPVTASLPVSLSSLAQSIITQDYTVVQLRRFFIGNGVVTVRERARVDANGTKSPDFELDFLGVEGEPQGSPLWQHWAQIYNEHGRLFFEHGVFRVRHLPSAMQNYSLHAFGPVTRAGRSAKRVVVFPTALDKSIWLIEVDSTTLVPLYVAEYDAQLRLLSEIEAVSFALGAQLGPTTAAASLVTTLPSFAAAKAFLGNPTGIVEPIGATAEYSLDKVEVRVEPLNNRHTLVLGYTDGVDEFFITETFGAPDFMAHLPVRQKPTESHTIARYRDPAMSVLLFWDDRVSFQVAGRGSLTRLDDFAQAVYTMAIYDR